MEYRHTFDTPLGPVTVTATETTLTAVDFGRGGVATAATPLLKEAARQIRTYMQGGLKMFTLPVAPVGTAFQQMVWKALQQIPYGEKRTYTEVAASIGRPKAARAVGGACHCNPIGIVIPCHRVVGADGSLTGYAGGLDRKEALLKLEQSR